MTATEPRADVADTWPLLALAYASGLDEARDGGADLGTTLLVLILIRPAASPRPAAVRAALGRLESAGLVSTRGNRFVPAGPIRAFLASRDERRGVGHDQRALVELLGPSLARSEPSRGQPA